MFYASQQHLSYRDDEWMITDSSVKSLDHLTDNRNWPFKIANKVIVNIFS